MAKSYTPEDLPRRTFAITMAGVALFVGVAIGLFQALTSIQELTLTFVPKLAAIAVAYWVAMGFMAGEVVTLFRDRLIPLIAGV